MVGSRKEGSRQKRPQLHGESQLFRQEGQGEADSQRQGDEHLPIEKVHDAVQQGREEVNPHNQPYQQIAAHEEQLADNALAAALAHGQGGEDDHHEHADQVFHNQLSHNQGRVFLPGDL